jgi:hypothetical protein
MELLIVAMDANASALRENSTVEKRRGKAKLAKTPMIMITMIISNSVKPLLLYFFMVILL